MRQERLDFIIKRTDGTFVRLHPEASGKEAHPLYSQVDGPWLTATGAPPPRISMEQARARGAHGLGEGSGGPGQGSGGVLAPAVGPWERVVAKTPPPTLERAPWQPQAPSAASQPPALQPPPQPEPRAQDHSGGDSQPAVACVVPLKPPPTRPPPALAADTNPQAGRNQADRKLVVAKPQATTPGGVRRIGRCWWRSHGRQRRGGVRHRSLQGPSFRGVRRHSWQRSQMSQ
jgi:hypothetical protein